MEKDGIYTSSNENSFKSIEQIESQFEQERIEHIFPDKKERSIDYERITEYLEEGKRIMQDFEIGQREATFVPDVEYENLPIVMLLASDIHYGSMGVNYKKLNRYLDIILNTPNVLLATNGDEVDAFNAVFHASAMAENPLPPQVQSRAIASKLLELDKKGKIAVMSQGNHNRSGALGGQDWYDTFLGQFNCPVFTSGGILNIRYGLAEYRMLLNHTYWGKSKLNPTNAVKRMIEYEGGASVDIGWLGHVHQCTYEHFERANKDILAVVSGTFKEDDKWAAQNGIGGRGQNPGISVMLWPNERRIQGFKDLEVASDYIRAMTKR